MKCATNFFRAFRDIATSVNTCGLWSVVTSWIKSFPGMSSTLQLFRTIPETCPKNNNCATFCWNEMFYQEIRQMSQLPPKSRWWGMGPMKRITTIWLESRKSLFAKKKTLNPNLRTRESTRWELQEEPTKEKYALKAGFTEDIPDTMQLGVYRSDLNWNSKHLYG